ncbi:MAG: DUF2271 domain-containing protein [Bryobacterales bacterium]|nr:DUF2271 domain-containing protein [Bryobacterales bacterium]
MTRKRFLTLLGSTPLLDAATTTAASHWEPRLFSFAYENVLGTSLDLRFLAESPAAAENAERAALSVIDRLNRTLSAFRPDSEFRRWLQSSGPRPISPDFFHILDQFDDWRERTFGALNPAAETINRVWRQAAAERRLPSRRELDCAVALASQPHWSLDRTACTATRLSVAPLALHSFAKSYIVDRAADAALASGARAAVVNIGGDLVVRGPHTESIAIAHPLSDEENGPRLATIQASNLAVATSGNYRRGVDIAGLHHSHIVDPRTGQPAGQIISATVAAPSAIDAGALATAFSILSPSESAWLASEKPGVEYLLVTRLGAHVSSPGWNRLALAMAPAAQSTPARSAAGTWDPSMELLVQFELARISDQRYRRPFVAVWVEDKDRFPVRTIALWYDKPRWLPDLRAWSRADRMRSMAEGTDITTSVSSATRSPGKYSVKWDGKDHQGKYVKAGVYTVFVEAAREHGTYQILRQEMEFTGKPRQVELTANVEIASASLDYRKAAR